ncbi:TetR/AcrR family transcriptional regulator [Streptomyces beijiangensis]
MAKREEILDTALEVIARDGYSRATVRELANSVGLSQAGLLHYFGTKEQLFVEILRRRDERDQRAYGEAVGAAGTAADIAGAFVRLVRHNAQVPGFVQLFTRFSSEASEEQHPAHAFFRDRYAVSRTITADTLRKLQEEGRLSPGLDPERLALMVFALIDGLQMQWLHDPDVDMADHVAYFWELVGLTPRTGGTPAG